MYTLLDIPHEHRLKLSYMTRVIDLSVVGACLGLLPVDDTSKCILGNISLANSSGYLGVRIPRSNSFYTGTGISARKVRRYLDLLETRGLVRQFSGGFDYHNGERLDLCSVVMIEKTLRDILVKEDVKLYSDVIHIRDRKTKLRRSNRGVAGVSLLADNVLKLNSLLLKTRYRLNDFDLPIQQFRRVFCDTINLGGRFYVAGSGGIQNIPSNARKDILINGEPSVELDYNSMHPSIILELKNCESTVEYTDPYGFVISDIENSGADFKTIRDYYKMALIIAMNCSSFKSATLSLNKIYEDNARFHIFGDSYSCKVLSAAYEHNTHLREYFFCDMGVFLQGIDGKIMANLLKSTTELGIPAYPIHDSVLVPKKYAIETEKLMFDSYHNVLGGSKFCRVSLK